MELALKEAELAKEEGEVPVGACVIKDGVLLSSAHNTREKDQAISGHAEINALKMAAKKLGTWDLSGCSLYVTLEPCLMCAGAILQSRVSSLYYGADDPSMGAIVGHYHVFDEPSTKGPLVYRHVKEEACAKILKDFFALQRK